MRYGSNHCSDLSTGGRNRPGARTITPDPSRRRRIRMTVATRPGDRRRWYARARTPTREPRPLYLDSSFRCRTRRRRRTSWRWRGASCRSDPRRGPSSSKNAYSYASIPSKIGFLRPNSRIKTDFFSIFFAKLDLAGESWSMAVRSVTGEVCGQGEEGIKKGRNSLPSTNLISSLLRLVSFLHPFSSQFFLLFLLFPVPWFAEEERIEGHVHGEWFRMKQNGGGNKFWNDTKLEFSYHLQTEI